MITFSCTNCGKSFTVGDEAAGKRGTCKTCGATVFVPPPVAPEEDRVVIYLDDPRLPATTGPTPRSSPPIRVVADAPMATPPYARATPPTRLPESLVVASPAAEHRDGNRKLPVRTRRLLADAEQVRQAFNCFPLIHVRSVTGKPPDRYQIDYFVRGLVRGPDGTPVYQDRHLAEIQLTSEYPRQSPKCKMLTPIFHPNFDPVVICVGDHWTAGERLVDLIIRIGEMIAYQVYNVKSPLDGEAAMWADQNSRFLPIDNRDIRPPGLA